MIMARVMINGGYGVSCVKMIMFAGVRGGFGQGIADVLRNRLAGTVIPAVAYPTSQLRH
jgi:hypothetical protein